MSAFPALVILAWHHVIFDALKKKKKNRFHSHTPAEIFTRETIRFKITCLYYVYAIMIQKGN